MSHRDCWSVPHGTIAALFLALTLYGTLKKKTMMEIGRSSWSSYLAAHNHLWSTSGTHIFGLAAKIGLDETRTNIRQPTQLGG